MNTVILGAQWGDEGKGKIVDFLADKYDYFVRFQGGANAGHTIVVNGIKTVLHLIPSGILHSDKVNVIGNGCVVEPQTFLDEVAMLIKHGIIKDWDDAKMRIRVSDRAHVVSKTHKESDSPTTFWGSGLGTTNQGIGPAYTDKASRSGARMSMVYKDIGWSFTSAMSSFITDTGALLRNANKEGKRILLEGAQGAMLDIDHGIYPFVTSSNTTVGGAITGTGLPWQAIGECIGVFKAYTTKVGGGTFPSSMECKGADCENHEDSVLAEYIRKKGKEYGSTTGRERRIGWLDLVALKYACEVNGFTSLVMTKADVLNGLDTVKVVTDYMLDGERIDGVPATGFERVEPVFETFEGWSKAHQDCHSLDRFVSFIECYTNVPVTILSVGPDREETVYL